MSDELSALKAANAQFATDFEALRTQNAAIIQALKDKIAAGGVATAADLQAMIDGTTALDAEAKSDLAAGAASGAPAATAATGTDAAAMVGPGIQQ